VKSWIRIRIKVMRIRNTAFMIQQQTIKEKSMIRIRINEKSWIRLRIKVMLILISARNLLKSRLHRPSPELYNNYNRVQKHTNSLRKPFKASTSFSRPLYAL